MVLGGLLGQKILDVWREPGVRKNSNGRKRKGRISESVGL